MEATTFKEIIDNMGEEGYTSIAFKTSNFENMIIKKVQEVEVKHSWMIIKGHSSIEFYLIDSITYFGFTKL